MDTSPRLCSNCRRLGVRLLKLEESESQPSATATAPQSPMPPMPADNDTPNLVALKEKRVSQNSSIQAPLPEDLRVLVTKLRKMTAVVGELQSSLGEAITTQRQHQKPPKPQLQRQPNKQIKLQKVAELMEELQATLEDALPAQKQQQQQQQQQPKLVHLEREVEEQQPQRSQRHDQVQLTKKKDTLIRF